MRLFPPFVMFFPHHENTPIYLYLLKPHFYTVKLGFTGVYIIFLIFAKNVDCGCSLEPPRRGGSNECPQSMFGQKYEKYQIFLSENFQILEVKFSIYLNMRVFVMLLGFIVVLSECCPALYHLAGEERAACFVFPWFVACVL